MNDKDKLAKRLYKYAYDSKVDKLRDRFADEDKNANNLTSSLQAKTLLGSGIGLGAGLLLTKLLDADDSAGIGRYALMGALGAAIGGGSSYYMNKPAVTSEETRNKLIEEAAKEDDKLDREGTREKFKSVNQLIGQAAMAPLTVRDLMNRIKDGASSKARIAEVEAKITSHPTGGKLFDIDPARDKQPIRTNFTGKKAEKKFKKALRSWQDLQHKKQLNAEVQDLLNERLRLKQEGYVLGDNAVGKATGVRQLKGFGKSIGLGLARHGGTALALHFLNKAL